ncbi:mobile mystery protein A [Sphingomonas sp.]|jgi:predicted DNA-binding mobile mystery protein A|uniref:mobile mystery protein A n=1 Tax=Sphingomonas sp. TaxID=28214 RepID=UPI002EDB9851
MNTKQQILARKHLEKRLVGVRKLELAVPPRGWMRAIREALGMSTRQLAERMGVSPSRVPTIEKAEVTGGTTIKTLREAAEAMNCTFVYTFVPVKPLDEILEDRAKEKARKDIARLDHTMKLENQALRRTDLQDEQQRLINGYLAGSPRQLWDN